MFVIQLYWLIPKRMRRKCLFKKTCSVYVYEHTKNAGVIAGMKSLVYRFKNCRHGVQLFIDPTSGEKKMILPDNSIINQEYISENILKSI
ncbi:hypothetical protein DEU42_102128 [Flavobacterium sp. AG291]|nr:hypothetical protein DEU42_102128 [Flavobacterium sp. AG291]